MTRLKPGNTLGQLTLLHSYMSSDGHGRRVWKCRCECGAFTYVRQDALLKVNPTISCGCAQVRYAKTGNAGRRHGRTYTLEWNSYRSMLRRCYEESYKSYKDYGGRGITVCSRWRQSFDNFFADIGVRPAGTTLGRIDNEKGYSPDNCAWINLCKQARNKRNTHLVSVHGERLSLSDAVEIYGVVAYSTVKTRLNRYGWPVLDALLTPSYKPATAVQRVRQRRVRPG